MSTSMSEKFLVNATLSREKLGTTAHETRDQWRATDLKEIESIQNVVISLWASTLSSSAFGENVVWALQNNLVIITLRFSSCLCDAEYELFHGFDTSASRDDATSASATAASTTTSTAMFGTHTVNIARIRPKVSKCPEEEKPSNIGPYEVPTQRDLVKHMKNVLVKRFNSYHQKTLRFLRDIKKASRATVEVENKCKENKATYKQCVKYVANQCEAITKNIVTSLELQRHDVNTFTEGQVCNLTSMKQDPVNLIKILAMESAAIDFALPGFLRLLSACTRYCVSSYDIQFKPRRHMTDQDLVIKHFLTRKSYKQLLMDSYNG